ncbi:MULTISPECIES: M23 family metallopeptidase [unclassified Enterobacter]|uniref:M23 family metallopeptidase n=1 Tax=unclassified Enterobacter TaxID=2608935 RepID=UPI0015CB54FA|nr:MULTISPECIES: M23 family metallopeptidase [unclassified Enterobacter]MBB3303950.1 putative chitinase [Enterobacter sp. Sphag1F]NYI12945.1 putative chitinase [Enterobacter sp. Sphag71]
MIISPPILKAKSATETDAAWISRVMASDVHRGFPVSAAGSWHGGIHIKHTDNSSSPEKVRAIADGKVVSFRTPANDEAKCAEPLNLNGATDNGYVLLKHETEIGSGENGKVVFYSLYMHLKSLNAAIKSDALIYRKDALGTSGMVDGENAFHFQIFCDDDNIEKLTGRKTQKLDITRDGRTDAVYGDIHFVLPVGTKFYNKTPENNSTATEGLSELHTSTVPLYASMTLAKGSCTVVTRQEDENVEGRFFTVGEALIDVDEKEYEYNLYKTAKSRYKNCPSAGYELLRFGRVINVDHEKLVPADAPLWMTINYPGGKGVVNFAVDTIKKFSDADFPHWMGWNLIDDDCDTNSQCNSEVLKKMQEGDFYTEIKGGVICKFPFEWGFGTFESRFSWLKKANEERVGMNSSDYDEFKNHVEALCFDGNGHPSEKVWSFEPKAFIEHFRRCGWMDCRLIKEVMTENTNKKSKVTINDIEMITEEYYLDINIIMRKYNLFNLNRISHFLGQGAVESGYLLSMQEVSQIQILDNGVQKGGRIVDNSTLNETSELGHWYGSEDAEIDNYYSGKKYNSRGGYIAGSYSWKNGNCGDLDAQKFRGRGFKMLTGLDTYSSYWVYRGWLNKDDYDSSWWTDSEYKKKNKAKMKKRPPNIDSPHKITENAYNCIDTGGFFICCFKKGVIKVMDADKLNNSDDDIIALSVTSLINGADLGLAQRKTATKRAKELIGDDF